jgi:hypothetical protein
MLQRRIDIPFGALRRWFKFGNRLYFDIDASLYWMQLPHGEPQLLRNDMPDEYDLRVSGERIVTTGDAHIGLEYRSFIHVMDHRGKLIMAKSSAHSADFCANSRGVWYTENGPNSIHLVDYAGHTTSFITPRMPNKWSMWVASDDQLIIGNRDHRYSWARYTVRGNEVVPLIGPIPIAHGGEFNVERRLDWFAITGNSYRRRVKLMLRLLRLPADLQRMVLAYVD